VKKWGKTVVDIKLSATSFRSVSWSFLEMSIAPKRDGDPGIGGGVYNLGTVTVDALTFIKFNHASTSHDNIFG
jgi:hypothetical protein